MTAELFIQMQFNMTLAPGHIIVVSSDATSTKFNLAIYTVQSLTKPPALIDSDGWDIIYISMSTPVVFEGVMHSPGYADTPKSFRISAHESPLTQCGYRIWLCIMYVTYSIIRRYKLSYPTTGTPEFCLRYSNQVQHMNRFLITGNISF